MSLRFEGYELDLDAMELSRDGQVLPLPLQPTRVLAYLAQNAGRTVTREELQEHVWPGQHVEADLGLNSCIRKIRAQLRDDANRPRFIQTLHRRGYRFVAELESAGPAQMPAPNAGSPRWHWVLLALVVPVMALLIWSRQRSPEPAPDEGEPVAIAVLPFQNLTADPGQDYVADGLTEETIARLGKLSPERLSVIGRTTAMQLKEDPRDLPAIADELGVDHLVEGSVRRENGRIRATVRLIDGESGTQRGTESYEVPTTDLLDAQVSLAGRITAWLVQELLATTVVTEPGIDGLGAEQYENYLRGLYRLQQGTGEDYLAARDLFAQTVAETPDFALGWTGLAEAELWLRWFGDGDPQDALTRARAAAHRALELAPDLAGPELLLGYAALYVDFDLESAGRHLERGARLEPGLARAQSWYAAYLSAVGDHVQALERAERARRLDPRAMVVHADLCWLYNYARRFERALTACESALELQPGAAWTQLGQIEALRQLGRAAEAVAIVESMTLGAATPWSAASDQAPEDALAAALEWLETATAGAGRGYVAAGAAAIRGEHETSLELLEQAWEGREMLLVFAGVDPRFDPIRAAPRFQELMAKLGLGAPAAPAL